MQLRKYLLGKIVEWITLDPGNLRLTFFTSFVDIFDKLIEKVTDNEAAVHIYLSICQTISKLVIFLI